MLVPVGFFVIFAFLHRRVSRCGATYFAHGGKVGKTPLEPTVQDSLGDACKVLSNLVDFANGIYAVFVSCTDTAMCRLPGGTTFLLTEMPATYLGMVKTDVNRTLG